MTRRHASSLCLILCSTLLCAHTALADSISSGHGADLVERSHVITLDLDEDRVAHAVARRVFENLSGFDDELVLDIDLPTDAAVTSLRVRDPHTGEWHDTVLESADLADAVYHDPGTTSARARRAALMSWQLPGRVTLEVTPVPARDTLELEYTLTLPTSYADGRHRIDWDADPDAGRRDLAVPEIRWARAPHGLETIDEQDVRTVVDGPVSLTAPTAFDVPAIGADEVDARLARIDVHNGLTLVQLGFDIAPRLSAMPSQATVALLIDTSHSMGADGLEAQLQVARSLVAQLPDAHVELIAYDRFARDVFEPGTVRGRDFDARLEAALERGALEPANGSALDVALDLAVERVAQRKPGTAARIVALTDELLRPSWTNQTVLDQTLATLDQDTVLHVVAADVRSYLSERRNDSGELAALARASGGIMLDLNVPTGELDEDEDAALNKATLGLIRPTRVDNLKLAGIDRTVFREPFPTQLDEGEGWQALARFDATPPDEAVVIQGEVWSTPFERTVARDADYDARIAGRLAVSRSMLSELEDNDIYLLATMGHVVSSQTSLHVEIERGRYEERHWGRGYGMGGSYCGGSSCSASTRCSPISAKSTVDTRAMYEPVLAACLAESGLEESQLQGRVAIGFDTTRKEVVEVTAQVDDDAVAGSDVLASCLVEATWAMQLDDRFYHERHHYDATF